MTIECYYSWCPYHSNNTDSEDGPFCYENECKADDKSLSRYERLRKEELQMIKEKEILSRID